MTYKWDQIFDDAWTDGFKLEKTEFVHAVNQWRVFFNKNSSIDAFYLKDIPMNAFKSKGIFPLLDEKLLIGSKVQFIAKNVTDLKSEGWNEDDKARLIKGPFFMGKKKQSFLGRLCEGTVGFNKHMEFGIFYDRFFFTDRQIKFVLAPIFNKTSLRTIQNCASNLTSDSWPDFFSKIHKMSLE